MAGKGKTEARETQTGPVHRQGAKSAKIRQEEFVATDATAMKSDAHRSNPN
jgi:hypothetical protein